MEMTCQKRVLIDKHVYDMLHIWRKQQSITQDQCLFTLEQRPMNAD